jgi:hypothetical protein
VSESAQGLGFDDPEVEERFKQGVADPGEEYARALNALYNAGRKREAPQAQAIADLARAQSELFVTPAGDPWASFRVGEHTETWPLGSKPFRSHLIRTYAASEKKPPGRQGVTDAIDYLAAELDADGEARQVWTRVALGEGSIYVDLGDKDWRAIQVTADGWQVVARNRKHQLATAAKRVA